ncbi:hypothetical protein [Dokdonia sp. Asnod1-B02]|uniref:hypothetical protein n=1 Tax=Dokdonia sp. Asnod1-B02 TaxID=3160573 RepID=UPI0038637767
MKKLLLAVLFLGGMTAQANTVTDLDLSIEKGKRYNQPQSITFTERGVEFEVFINGHFDFERSQGRIEVSNRGRRVYTRSTPGQTNRVTYASTNKTSVKYNRKGDIYQVGRNDISYNRKGQVSKIGTIALRYQNGRLTQVGTKNVIYNRYGVIVKLSNNPQYNINKRQITIKNNKRLRG